MKLVILGRDGVINHHRDDVIRNTDQWHPIEGSIEAIAQLHQAGFTVVIATNQAGLALGLFDLDDLESIHHKLTEMVEDEGGEISAIFYCPHSDDDQCKCRKPLTGLLEAIETEFNTSLQEVPLIGCSLADLQAGSIKDCQLILVETGHHDISLEKDTDNFSTYDDKRVAVYSDLSLAVSALIE